MIKFFRRDRLFLIGIPCLILTVFLLGYLSEESMLIFFGSFWTVLLSIIFVVAVVSRYRNFRKI